MEEYNALDHNLAAFVHVIGSVGTAPGSLGPRCPTARIWPGGEGRGADPTVQGCGGHTHVPHQAFIPASGGDAFPCKTDHPCMTPALLFPLQLVYACSPLPGSTRQARRLRRAPPSRSPLMPRPRASTSPTPTTASPTMRPPAAIQVGLPLCPPITLHRSVADPKRAWWPPRALLPLVLCPRPPQLSAFEYTP